jgi:heme-degrading monooxygenase HmoA
MSRASPSRDSEPGLPIAPTPEPPYYAVIFTSIRTARDPEEYARVAAMLDALARSQPGFLGIESVRDAGGTGITVSYWASEEAIFAWKRVAEHAAAQRLGRERWYEDYTLRVARVERAYTRSSSAAEGLGENSR